MTDGMKDALKALALESRAAGRVAEDRMSKMTDLHNDLAGMAQLNQARDQALQEIG